MRYVPIYLALITGIAAGHSILKTGKKVYRDALENFTAFLLISYSSFSEISKVFFIKLKKFCDKISVEAMHNHLFRPRKPTPPGLIREIVFLLTNNEKNQRKIIFLFINFIFISYVILYK